MPLLLHIPGFPSRYRRPSPPHSPLRTGSAWLPQPGNVHSAGAWVRPDWGRGKESGRPRGEQCAGVRAGSVTPAAGLGARAVGGAEAGAAHRPLASAGLTPLRAASRGSRGSPASVPFPQVEGAAWDARAGVQWERAPPCCCQWRRMGPGPGVVRVCRVGSLPGCSVVPRRECCHRPRCACGGERRCGRLVWAFCSVSLS